MQAHQHAHAPHGHASLAGGRTATGRAAQRHRLRGALALAATYMVAEVVGGWLTGSLALLADAGHMASDVASLALALFALWWAERPADARRTYGHARAEILAALVQGAALGAVAVVVAWEAIERLSAPTVVLGPGMLAIAMGGLAVNALALWLLSPSHAHGGHAHGHEQSLTMRGAWLHVASDALGSLAAIVAGAAIWLRGWTWADPAASLVICALILVGGWRLLGEAVDVLMEAAPRHLDVEEIRRALGDLDGASGVHDLHVWSIGSGEVSLSCHLVASPVEPVDTAALLDAARLVLRERFAIEHSTVQIELTDLSPSERESCHGGCEPLT